MALAGGKTPPMYGDGTTMWAPGPEIPESKTQSCPRGMYDLVEFDLHHGKISFLERKEHSGETPKAYALC